MPSGLNADTPQALASLANLDEIKADVLLPGHGKSWTRSDPAGPVRRALMTWRPGMARSAAPAGRWLELE